MYEFEINHPINAKGLISPVFPEPFAPITDITLLSLLSSIFTS